jgi:hypothetical protein
VTALDVVYALKRQEMTLYGFETDLLRLCLPVCGNCNARIAGPMEGPSHRTTKSPFAIIPRQFARSAFRGRLKKSLNDSSLGSDGMVYAVFSVGI